MVIFAAIFRKQSSMWAAGDAERERSRIYLHRESDKMRKIEKQDKLDRLEKLEQMEGSDRVKHLEAQMLSQIRAMDLEPKMKELMADEEVGSCQIYVLNIRHYNAL